MNKRIWQFSWNFMRIETPLKELVSSTVPIAKLTKITSTSKLRNWVYFWYYNFSEKRCVFCSRWRSYSSQWSVGKSRCMYYNVDRITRKQTDTNKGIKNGTQLTSIHKIILVFVARSSHLGWSAGKLWLKSKYNRNLSAWADDFTWCSV